MNDLWNDCCIRVYTELEQGKDWLNRHRGQIPIFACVLGFTETGLVPGISAAGATPDDRRYTAIADAEFLINGPQKHPTFALPPLQAGISPVFISRAVVEALQLPVVLFDAGLPVSPTVPAIALGGMPARCLSTGQAMPLPTVEHLFQQGMVWGDRLASGAQDRYLILGECVVGGTTTALAVLTGWGIAAGGKVNSSHPICNHQQKWDLVQTGLAHAVASSAAIAPLALIAAVGDPMQIVVAGMAIAASRTCGVMLAGGTQMLAVYALMQAIAQTRDLDWNPDQVVIGTTRWVAEDPTGDTIGLARLIDKVPLIATQLNFTQSRYEALRLYERGFVKEGVGAGACAIAASLAEQWNQPQLLQAVESLIARSCRDSSTTNTSAAQMN